MKLSTIIVALLAIAVTLCVTSAAPESWSFRTALLAPRFSVKTNSTYITADKTSWEAGPTRQVYITEQDHDPMGNLTGVSYTRDTTVDPPAVIEELHFVVSFDPALRNAGTITFTRSDRIVKFEFTDAGDVWIASGIWEGTRSYQMFSPSQGRILLVIFETADPPAGAPSIVTYDANHLIQDNDQ